MSKEFTRHGGPWDRGSADAYYDRPFQPHYFKGDTYNSEKVERAQMTEGEIAAYTDGYGDQDEIKEW
jgi:hypothetical protein